MRKGALLMWRAAEAELYGHHEVIISVPGVTVTRMVGTYGSLYETECHSIWMALRIHAILASLPQGAAWSILPGDCNPDEAGDGVLVIHHWRDAHATVTARDRDSTVAQISQPAK